MRSIPLLLTLCEGAESWAVSGSRDAAEGLNWRPVSHVERPREESML